MKCGKALVFPDHVPTAPRSREKAVRKSPARQIMVWFCVLQDSFLFVLRRKCRLISWEERSKRG